MVAKSSCQVALIKELKEVFIILYKYVHIRLLNEIKIQLHKLNQKQVFSFKQSKTIFTFKFS